MLYQVRFKFNFRQAGLNQVIELLRLIHFEIQKYPKYFALTSYPTLISNYELPHDVNISFQRFYMISPEVFN